MKKLLFAFCLFASSAHAQTKFDDLTPYLPTETGRRYADVASWVGVGASLTIDTYAAFTDTNRKRALLTEGARLGATFGGAELIKHFTHRERPCNHLTEGCGVDDPYKSFPSLHTAFVFSTLPTKSGSKFAITMSLVGSSLTAANRVAAGKHWLTDVLGGAALGTATSFIR